MKTMIFFILFSFSVSSFASGQHYHIDHRIALGGSESWDYLAVDPSTSRLFVTRANHVDVFDLKTEKLVGSVLAPVDGAHGVAFAMSLKKAYITSGKSEKVVVIDLTSLKVLKEIPAGKKPDAVVFDQATSRVFAFNAVDASVTVIDAVADKVIKTIKLDGKPEFAVSDGDGNIYFNNEDKSSLCFLNARKMEIIKSWPLVKCKSPTGLAADFASKRLFSVCENEMMAVTDSYSGKLVQSISIGKGPDAVVFDEGVIYSSNGSGSLTIVQEVTPNHFEVIENLATQEGARTMAVDPATHTAYLIAAHYEAPDAKAPEARRKIVAGSVELLVVKKNN